MVLKGWLKAAGDRLCADTAEQTGVGMSKVPGRQLLLTP